MAEPELNLTYSEIRTETGKVWGIGADHTLWSAADAAHIETLLRSGQRQAYSPPPLPGEQAPHVWGFLAPINQIVTIGDVGDYELPSGVTHVRDYITFAAGTPYAPIRICGEAEIRDQRGFTGSGIPRLAAVQAKNPQGTTTQRYMLRLFPIPQGQFILEYACTITPPALSDNNPFPLGDYSFGECLLESCLSKAEERDTDAQGVHKQLFMEKLATAVGNDRIANAPALLGRNRDRSTGFARYAPHGLRGWSDHVVTVNGT